MKMITEALGGLAIAFRTLTILSIPGRNAERMASALPWFPIVGLTLGLIIYGSASAVDYAASHKWPEVPLCKSQAAPDFSPCFLLVMANNRPSEPTALLL